MAAPEAADELAEPARQQPAAQPPLEEESAGLGAPEAARSEDAKEEAAAGPEPEVRAEPAEEAAPGPAASSPPPSSEEPAPQAEAEPPGEQAGEQCAEEAAATKGSAAEAEPRAVENGEEDEPSFSDPEDFVDDVSEEGEGASVAVGGRDFCSCSSRVGSCILPSKKGSEAITRGAGHLHRTFTSGEG